MSNFKKFFNKQKDLLDGDFPKKTGDDISVKLTKGFSSEDDNLKMNLEFEKLTDKDPRVSLSPSFNLSDLFKRNKEDKTEVKISSKVDSFHFNSVSVVLKDFFEGMTMKYKGSMKGLQSGSHEGSLSYARGLWNVSGGFTYNYEKDSSARLATTFNASDNFRISGSTNFSIQPEEGISLQDWSVKGEYAGERYSTTFIGFLIILI
eukprot:TRINITY_DN1752_c0_g1_i2.p1 TRINITY_DN1752_c0_g1~~TRINITY_DN1752_c0_g1_i2.p1  ORF type:complete len:205 (+),score=50.57 TRINITY_DN1752_c0_g1_i2:8-622(+)